MLRTIAPIALISIGALVGISGEAAAQQISSPYEFIERKRDIGPIGGYIFADRGAANVGPSSGPYFGLQGTFSVSNPLKLSAFVAYFPGERDVIDPTPQLVAELRAGRAMYHSNGDGHINAAAATRIADQIVTELNGILR